MEQKFSGNSKNPLNKFFSKIFIINLDDNTKRLANVTKQFVRQGVKYTRFPAIDGRCDKTKPGACSQKRRALAEEYNVTIKRTLMPAAAALVIGTREILLNAIKRRYRAVLICEDDIVFGRNMVKHFKEGIKELKSVEPGWDLLYLGSGGYSGVRGISQEKTQHNKYKTSLSIVDKDIYDWHVHHKDDLRSVCEDGCEIASKHLSFPYRVGGGWCYAISLKGAKKIVKRLANVDHHIDQIIPDMSLNGELKTVVFDPPIVWHEKGAFRPDSNIPWEW